MFLADIVKLLPQNIFYNKIKNKTFYVKSPI